MIPIEMSEIVKMLLQIKKHEKIALDTGKKNILNIQNIVLGSKLQ